MKINLIVVVLGVFFSPFVLGIVLPPEIAKGISQSTSSESGGFGVRGVDEQVYGDYIKKHWREIVDNVESLPPAQAAPGFLFGNDKAAKNAGAANFCASCEVLPPAEYLEFLEKWLDLYEQGKIEFPAIDRISGLQQKRDFLSYNWKDPRVQKILKRAQELAPPEEKDFINVMASMQSGRMEEGYLYQWKEGDPKPQRLSAITRPKKKGIGDNDGQNPLRSSSNRKPGETETSLPSSERIGGGLLIAGFLVVVFAIVAKIRKSSSALSK